MVHLSEMQPGSFNLDIKVFIQLNYQHHVWKFFQSNVSMLMFTEQNDTSNLPCLRLQFETGSWADAMTESDGDSWLFYIFQPPFFFTTLENVLTGLLPILTFL